MSALISRLLARLEGWLADNRPIRAKTAERRALESALLARDEARA